MVWRMHIIGLLCIKVDEILLKTVLTSEKDRKTSENYLSHFHEKPMIS